MCCRIISRDRLYVSKYKIILVQSQGHFSSTFSVVGRVNFRTRLERPLVHSMGDSEIFHVQLLKMLMKNDPGIYDNFVLVKSVPVIFRARGPKTSFIPGNGNLKKDDLGSSWEDFFQIVLVTRLDRSISSITL